jgi:hypothetical protein
MRLWWIATVAGAAACGEPAATTPAMPWLQGFQASATSEVETAAVGEQLVGLVGVAEDDGYGGLQVVADVAPAEGPETVLASYHQGVAVVGHDGRLLAKAPGFEAMGSRDDLVALAAGDAQLGAPVIAVAVERGGHRESATSIILYRVRGARLEPVFEGAIEEHEDGETWTGSIAFGPHGLVYRAPRAVAPTLWIFEPARGHYIERAAPRCTHPEEPCASQT